MNIDANGEKESPDDEKGIKDRVLGERQSTVHFSKLNGDPANQMEKHGDTSDIQGSSTLQVQQQQQTTQGTLVGWERFLHVRSIRVLLVEFDDCTRHVVTALLRNCNYEVLDAANGLQAWKILEDLTNHIDIVLTEVVMPFLSGVGLLHKIMSHSTRKNIPVIMMSSHDSMGLVFKCLSKGAVDFLVKPIRKNELKNLWQHVWRRCHSSSGSGSESGTQTQKSVKSRGRERSSNSSSDGGENDGSNGLDTGDGSDNGSGTQSSWTKQAVEADSSQAVSPMNRVAECPDSTCAQVIRSNAENSGNEKMKASMEREGSGQKQPDTTAKCNKNLETIAQRRVEFRSEDHVGSQLIPTAKESDSTTEVTDRINTKHKANDDCIEPSLELSLKRPRGVTDTDRTIQEDRYVLRRSEQSAFSRYNTFTNFFKAPNGGTGSSSIVDNSVAAAKRDSAGMQVYSADHILHQCSNGIGNTIDMGSATNKFPKDKSEATSAVNGLNPSAFRLVKNEIAYNQQPVKRLRNGIQTTDPCPILASNHELRIQHPHQRDHHKSHRHLHIDQPLSNHDGSSLKKLDLDASHCGSTNVGGQMDGDRRNYSLNKSASGSNHGSNGPNGSSPAGNNAESDVGQDGKSGNGDASGSGSATRAAETKLTQREAALIKFRQKRKERCFKKKVRYQNRKKLAEQRPRVRGKFVKQTGTDSSNGTGDEYL